MLKVAFASNDRETINQHFGATEGFVIFGIDTTRAQLVEVIEFPPESMDGNENKLPAKVQSLAGCAAVYCLAAGASAVRQLLAIGVQPVRLEEAAPIEPVLTELRKALNDGGIPWLEKAMRLAQRKRESDDTRFDKMAEEGWQE